MSIVFEEPMPHEIRNANATTSYYGNYRGFCVSNEDPLAIGRIKIYVPGVYPEEFMTQPNELPWAEPAWPVFGASMPCEKNSHNLQSGYFSVPRHSQSGIQGIAIKTLFIDPFPSMKKEVSGPLYIGDPKGQPIVDPRGCKLSVTYSIPTVTDGGKGYKVDDVCLFKYDNTYYRIRILEVTAEPKNIFKGAQLWLFFEQGNHLKPIYFAAVNVEEHSDHPEQSVFKTDNVTIRIDEKLEDPRSTCKFDSNNSLNNVLSTINHSLSAMPTRVDIQIENTSVSGCALNLYIKGNTNVKIVGDVYEEILGNKHETIIGNTYRKQDGDVFWVLSGDMVMEHYGDWIETSQIGLQQNSSDKIVVRQGNLTEHIFETRNTTIGADDKIYIAGADEKYVGDTTRKEVWGAQKDSVAGDYDEEIKGRHTVLTQGANNNAIAGANTQMITSGHFEIFEKQRETITFGADLNLNLNTTVVGQVGPVLTVTSGDILVGSIYPTFHTSDSAELYSSPDVYSESKIYLNFSSSIMNNSQLSTVNIAADVINNANKVSYSKTVLKVNGTLETIGILDINGVLHIA